MFSTATVAEEVLAHEGRTISLGAADPADKTIAPYGRTEGRAFSVCIEGGGVDQDGHFEGRLMVHGIQGL